MPGASVAFYFDVGSPYAYLAAERIEDVLEGPVEWRPVLLGGLFRETGRSSWAQTPDRAQGIAEIERRAAERGLPALRWPSPWPNDGLLAMRAAVVAAAQGRTREFALAAMRMQFRDGAPLSDPGAVEEAAARAGLNARDALRLAQSPAMKDDLRARTEAALAAGVTGVPSFALPDGRVLWGDDQLDTLAT